MVTFVYREEYQEHKSITPIRRMVRRVLIIGGSISLIGAIIGAILIYPTQARLLGAYTIASLGFSAIVAGVIAESMAPHAPYKRGYTSSHGFVLMGALVALVFYAGANWLNPYEESLIAQMAKDIKYIVGVTTALTITSVSSIFMWKGFWRLLSNYMYHRESSKEWIENQILIIEAAAHCGKKEDLDHLKAFLHVSSKDKRVRRAAENAIKTLNEKLNNNKSSNP